MATKSCELCAEFNKELENLSQPSRILACNDDLLIFPTIGCFKEGYLLLSTKKHYVSLYNCPNRVISNVQKTIVSLNKYYQLRMQSDMIFFEHGTIGNFAVSSASVTHFHMHFLPIDRPFWPYLQEKYCFNYYKLGELNQIKECVNAHNMRSYLLFGDSSHDIFLIDGSNDKYQPQFFRKILYDYYYDDDDNQNGRWDWRKYAFNDKMKDTFSLFKGIEI